MTKDNSRYSLDEISDIVLGTTNFIFAIFAIFYIVAFLAPLFGGVFDPMTIVSFLYWTGYYFLLRFTLKIMKRKKRLKTYQYLLEYIYISAPIIAIVPMPYNFIVFIILAFIYLKGMQAYFKSCASESGVNQETAQQP